MEILSRLLLVTYMVKQQELKRFLHLTIIVMGCLNIILFKGDSTCGQRALYELGMTGIPIYNVHNNCSTGSTALYLGKQLIEGRVANCVLATGFEKMERGSLTAKV